jgi:hypothetical protein
MNQIIESVRTNAISEISEAYLPLPRRISLDLEDYPGGVAAWGALPAVFDNHSQEYDRGVHIHARCKDSGKKYIDQSFQEIEIRWNNKSIILTEANAVCFTMSSIFNIEIQSHSCKHCGIALLDQGLAAVKASYDHYCSFCGQLTTTNVRCVVNPIMAFKEYMGDFLVQRPSILPSRRIHLSKDNFPGGFQIWGSNPSIIWTAKRNEESAIHVHAYNQDNRRIIDNTYSEVWVDTQLLDINMVRVLQIQKSLPALLPYLTTIQCPNCAMYHFDRELHAVVPHQKHQCESCYHEFVTSLAISNPAFAILESLNQTINGVY